MCEWWGPGESTRGGLSWKRRLHAIHITAQVSYLTSLGITYPFCRPLIMAVMSVSYFDRRILFDELLRTWDNLICNISGRIYCLVTRVCSFTCGLCSLVPYFWVFIVLSCFHRMQLLLSTNYSDPSYPLVFWGSLVSYLHICNVWDPGTLHLHWRNGEFSMVVRFLAHSCKIYEMSCGSASLL